MQSSYKVTTEYLSQLASHPESRKTNDIESSGRNVYQQLLCTHNSNQKKAHVSRSRAAFCSVWKLLQNFWEQLWWLPALIACKVAPTWWLHVAAHGPGLSSSSCSAQGPGHTGVWQTVC